MFWHGCNYPWSTDGTNVYYGMDFGANVWGSHTGVSTRRRAIAADFERMAGLGFTVARWFVFADGRSGIEYDGRGLPAGPDSHLYADLDAALGLARDVDIRLVLVLLDHRWMFEGVPDVIADPLTGALLEARLSDGRAQVLDTHSGRHALMQNVIEPLVRRYGTAGERADLGAQILAFEFMNEPDFIIEEWERDLSSRVMSPLRFEILAELVSRTSEVVHLHTRALTTMASARLHNLWAWGDPELGIDFVQVHSYPDVNQPARDADVFGMPAASLGIAKPIVLGEFPGNAPEQCPPGAAPPATTLDQYLEFAVGAGYLGAWPWSFSGTDAYGRFPEAPLREFARRHPELVNPRAR
ncbi:MAG TPA: hypothetical protein VMS40_21165 [Vicinamibacterales bacterium]|nr:hypothetical protein [Vicinamibacterales bacterium]